MNRKINLFAIICLLFITTISCTQNPTTLYVSPSGKDTNPGTENRPLASINRAIALVHEVKGDKPNQIIIKDGEYFMQKPIILTSDDSGTETLPLVIKADEGAKPVFYGGKKLPKFEYVSENLWRVKIPEVTQYNWYFEQLIVNGKQAIRAKTPNSGFFFLSSVDETVLKRGTGRRAELTSKKIMLSDDGMTELCRISDNGLDNVIFTFYHKWDNTRKYISAVDKDSSAIFTVGPGMAPWNKLDNKTRYSIENYKAALDTCGEWFLENSGYLYYIPRKNEIIENTIAVAPCFKQLVVLKGDAGNGEKVKNVRFEGLSFQASAYTMPAKGDGPTQAAYPVDAVVMADYAENIHINNCEISNTANNAVWLRNSCTDCNVTHCYFHDLGAGGIKIGTPKKPGNIDDLTKNIIVDNNIIRSGGNIFPAAVGLTIFNASDNQIIHNEIANFRYSGISVGWTWGYKFSPTKRNKIEFNHIHHLGWGELCDMGGVYCLGKSEGTSVSNNVIHDIYSFEYGGWGLYTDEGSTGIVMENNLVYKCKDSGFHQHYGENNIVRNNIFVNNIIAQLQATRIEGHISFTFSNNIVCFNSGKLIRNNWSKIKLETDYNCYWDTRTKDIRFDDLSFEQWQKTGKDEHSIIADPKFADIGKLDFSIENKAVIKAIDFKVFDYSQAGVYGSDEWTKLAGFDPGLSKLFDEAVARNEERRKLNPHFP